MLASAASGLATSSSMPIDESCRLAMIISASVNGALCARILQRTTRVALDAKNSEPAPWDLLAEQHNDGGNGVVGEEAMKNLYTDKIGLSGIDPTQGPPEARSGEYLKAHWATLKSSYTVTEGNFKASGQMGSADKHGRRDFSDFTTDKRIIYLHYLEQDRAIMTAMVQRCAGEDQQDDEGAPGARAKKPKKTGASKGSSKGAGGPKQLLDSDAIQELCQPSPLEQKLMQAELDEHLNRKKMGTKTRDELKGEKYRTKQKQLSESMTEMRENKMDKTKEYAELQDSYLKYARKLVKLLRVKQPKKKKQ